MSIINPYQAYQNNQINTASPGELTLMLYNGIVKFTKQAKLAIEAKENEKANDYLHRAQDIITELTLTLNMDYEISYQLKPLYEYMKSRLIEANIKKDPEIVTEVENMALEFRETWVQAIKKAKGV